MRDEKREKSIHGISGPKHKQLDDFFKDDASKWRRLTARRYDTRINTKKKMIKTPKIFNINHLLLLTLA